MSDVSSALSSLRPGAQWSCFGGTYAGINWLDQVQTKPTLVEVNAEITRLDGVSSAETTRQASIRADAGRADLLTRLKTATPSQIDTWVDVNVTTIASARTVLKAIIKVIALDARD